MNGNANGMNGSKLLPLDKSRLNSIDVQLEDKWRESRSEPCRKCGTGQHTKSEEHMAKLPGY